MIPVRAYLAIGLIAVGGLAVWYVMDLRADLAACAVQRDSMAQQINDQNAAIESVRAKGLEAQEALAKALSDKTKAQAAAARREAVSRLPAPASCDEAFTQWDAEVKK